MPCIAVASVDMTVVRSAHRTLLPGWARESVVEQQLLAWIASQTQMHSRECAAQWPALRATIPPQLVTVVTVEDSAGRARFWRRIEMMDLCLACYRGQYAHSIQELGQRSARASH